MYVVTLKNRIFQIVAASAVLALSVFALNPPKAHAQAIISNFKVTPSSATAGDTVEIDFTLSEAPTVQPTVEINTNIATFVSNIAPNYSYSYLVLPTDTRGDAVITILDGPVILDTNDKTLRIVPPKPVVSALTNINSLNFLTYKISGDGEAKDTITGVLTDKNGLQIDFLAVVGADGKFSTTLPDLSSLADGPISISVYQTDKDNINSGIAQIAINKDVVAPVATIVTQPVALSNNPSATILIELASPATTFKILDSQNNIIASGVGTGLSQTIFLSDLTDGTYSLELVVSDAAGNVTTIPFNSFKVDKTSPPISSTETPDGQTLEVGATLVFSGTTEASAQVALEVFSDVQTQTAQADSNGNYRFEINSNLLGLGSHEAYITVTDAVGNFIKTRIASFTIISKPIVTIASKPKVAIRRTVSKVTASDVTPQVVAATTPDTNSQDVAKAGQVSSASDTSVTPINWSAWIILLIIVVLVSLLAAAGYYGYEWVSASRVVATKPKIDKESRNPIKIVESSSKPSRKVETPEADQDKPKTRW